MTNEKGRKVVMLDIEPRWIDLAPYFIDLLEDNRADEKAKELARSNIMQMAKALTHFRRIQKAKEKQEEE